MDVEKFKTEWLEAMRRAGVEIPEGLDLEKVFAVCTQVYMGSPRDLVLSFIELDERTQAALYMQIETLGSKLRAAGQILAPFVPYEALFIDVDSPARGEGGRRRRRLTRAKKASAAAKKGGAKRAKKIIERRAD